MEKALLMFAAALLVSGNAMADRRGFNYEVTITNITQGQTFTPILAATHRSSISFFELGHMASAPLATLAESGDVGPLKDVLDGLPDLVFDTAVREGVLVGPGDEITIKIQGNPRFNKLSFAAMLIPTNDTFVAANTVTLPTWNTTVTVPAYDAGSEINDELCANIPGPFCGGEGSSDGSGEGFVHISNGVHGIGDLDDAVLDWKNPVAKVTIRRVR